jgi:glycosyltransferase involved in cell wall biosynthesis
MRSYEVDLGRYNHAIAQTLEPSFQQLGEKGVGGMALTVTMQHKGLNERGIPTILIGPKPYSGEIDCAYPFQAYCLQELLNVFREGEDAVSASSDTLLEMYSDGRVVEKIRDLIPEGEGILGAHFYTTQGLLNHGWQTDKKILYVHHSPFTRVRNLYDPRAVVSGESTKASEARKQAEGWLLTKSDAVVFFTEAEANLTRQMYPEFDLSNIRVIPLGIDASKFNPETKQRLRGDLRKRFGFQDADIVIYMQARIGASQGQLLLAQLFTEYLADHPKLKLAIIGSAARGEDNYLAQIQELAQKSQGKIVLTGPLKPQEGHALGDVGVGLKLETWGYANLEVMAMGNPLITQDNPIHREVYQGNGGVLYLDIRRMKDAEYVESFMNAVIDHLNRPEWFSFCRQQNPRKVSELTWRRSIDRLEETMKELLSQS